jgi:hypothetical protein|tara:strand:- start:402 stop:794 length:393 start_codon:yes stop_codon:yes gene_type:complete
MDPVITNFSSDMTSYLAPWAAILLSLIIAAWIKNFVDAFVKGATFKMNAAFNEGDKVILDGNDALIVKIGLRESIFGVYSDKGFTWRYVPNERIPFLKLEKVINKDLHLDTEQEKAQKIQQILDTKNETV